MSASPGPRLNLDLYQLQNTARGPEAISGMSVNVGEGGELFVDPQLERNSPGSYGPAEEGSLILGVDPSVVVFNGCVHAASLSLEDGNPHLNLGSIGSEKLAPPSPQAIGRAALLGLAEHEDLRLDKVSASRFSQTRLLHETGISVLDKDVPYAAKLILMAGTGFVDIASGRGKDTQTFRLRYDDSTGRLRMEGADEGGEYEGGNSDDPLPVAPRDPLDTGSISLKIPRQPVVTDSPVPAPVLI